MDDPVQDIPKVIYLILGSKKKDYSPQEIVQYYCESVEFKGFLTYIPSGRCSRDNFIALNRFYKGYIFSDKTTIHEIFFNEDHNKVVIDVTHFARRGVFFWVEQPIRIMIKLDLTYRNDGKYIIKRQEILCQPEEVVGAFVPFLVPSLLSLQKLLLTSVCVIIGKGRELIGYKSNKILQHKSTHK
ncbi:putative inorganic phosphate transporter [Gigaspora margarita]|uniref:Putative inorganic phosphate transporter n=1 Tax=Gigaspora margarita TaxID=4874 RepID=A0A8H4ES16_GIGMA|nr:putative inorganic phosphate transporter [Gigaspora margarita]